MTNDSDNGPSVDGFGAGVGAKAGVGSGLDLDLGFDLGRPVQVAYGVDDIDLAIARWGQRGIGPFVVRRHIPVDQATVFGEPQAFDHSSAFAWWGPTGSDSVMVELICEHPGEAGRRLVDTSGLHHMAFFVDHFEAATTALAEHGWPPALRARAGETWFAFHDARDELGHFIEIYEPSAGLLGFYDTVAHLGAET